ncbi:hypothetical protein K3495_g13369 [Podosphaera aphanis]|nr:hypothetical protein K3495_g13369 [Podosphaera aphanis]
MQLSLIFHLCCYAAISVATPTATRQKYPEGYKCGQIFYGEGLRITVESTPKQRYHGHIKFGQDVFEVRIPGDVQSLREPSYIIVDRHSNIISVISPNLVDSSVDSNEDNIPKIDKAHFPKSFMHYRMCEEFPSLLSISHPTSGFKCDYMFLRTPDAIRAANSARKIFKKNQQHSYRLSHMVSRIRLRPNFSPLTFDRKSSQYTLSITAQGNVDKNGHISIILNKFFDVIGAQLRKSNGNKMCYLSTYVSPMIIGHSKERGQKEITGYKCNPDGHYPKSLIILFAKEVPRAFELKEKNPDIEFPQVYKGALFPDLSEPLYYFPLLKVGLPDPSIPTYLVVTRSCDVAGVLQYSNKGFKLCEKIFPEIKKR